MWCVKLRHTTYHVSPSVALSLDRFGTILPSERCPERIHLVEIRRRLFSSREKDLSSRPAPLRKVTADHQRLGVLLFRQLLESPRAARHDGRTAVRYLLEKGLVVDIGRIVVLLFGELPFGNIEMGRDDTANGGEPLILSVLFRRRNQSRANEIGFVRRLVFAWVVYGAQEIRNGDRVSQGLPRWDEEELGFEGRRQAA